MTRARKVLLMILSIGLCGSADLVAQIVATGAGSYTTTLPAGATAPPSKIYTTTTGPVQTHRYWSGKNAFPLGQSGGGAYNLDPQPLQSNVTAQGLSIGIHGNVDGYPANDATAFAFFQYSNLDMTIGNASLNAADAKVSAFSDWSVDYTWGPSLTVRTGRGMPFAYIMTDGTPVTVSFVRTPTVVTNNANTLAVSTPEGDSNFTNFYGLFCPVGGTWAQSGNVFTCNAPSGSNYASVALLPGTASPVNLNTSTVAQQLSDFSKVAFSFPTDTQVSWNYNESTSAVTTTYAITTQSMDGSSTGFLSALYPHQYDALSGGVNTTYSYLTNHGYMKVNSGNSFSTTDTYHGILPFLPPTTNYNMAKLKSLVDAAPTAGIAGDDYAEGKVLGKVAQVLPLASISDPAAFTAIDSSLKSTLQTWFTATPSKASTDDSFYYDSNWGSLIAYPASFGSDNNLNDHQFHYGYFIHAAAMDGLFNPDWISDAQWGGMVGLLQQDIANYDRSNTMFPFMRHFDPYAGHSWANGAAGFLDGENEESSSEAINAWTGMILLGASTGNIKMRDAGIWLYTQETKAAAYYWFNEKPKWVNANAAGTFPPWFSPLRIANNFDAKGDASTFFGNSPDFEHGIEFLPFTGGSLHLGLDPSYVQANYNEDVAANAAYPAANGNTQPTLWPDLMEMYEALSDPATALGQWQSVTDPTDGETLAHEYAWLMTLNALGQVDASVTANTPFYAVFNNSGTKSHVAFNPSNAAIDVTFSDGVKVTVPADTMASDSALVTPVTLGSGVVTAQPPSAPTGVTATAKSSTEIDLTWTLVSNVTYNVYRGTTTGFTPDGSNQVANGLTAGSYADMGLAASTTYYYVVVAVNSGGSSPASIEASAMTRTGGGGGGGGTAVPVSNTLYLIGGATAAKSSLLSFTNGAGGVDQIPANSVNAIGTVTNPLIYTVSGVSGTFNSAATTAFDFFVDPGNNAGSGVQAEIQYDLDGTGANVVTQLYAFFATNPIVDFEDYNAQARGGLQSTTGTLGDMTNGKITIQIWNALPSNPNAPVSLTIGNYSGSSNVNTQALSNLVIPFTSVTELLNPPVTPTGLTAMATSSSTVALTWTASTTVGVNYSLFRSTTTGFTPAAGNQIASQVTGTTFTDANLDPSTIYYYAVEAVNALGSSAASAQATATTPAAGGPTPGTNTLFLVAGATGTMPGKLSFSAGPLGADMIPVNNPQSPDTPMNALVYTITGINATYDSTKQTAFNLFIDAATHVGEAAQVEVLYDPTGSGTFSRVELYHFFGTDPLLGYEQYTETSRGGLESATGTLTDMVNGTVQILVWEALPGPDAAPMTLSVGTNPSAQAEIVIPFNTVTQNPPGPAAPTSVMATAKSSTEVDLSWNASTTQGVTYNVYRSTTSGFKPAAGNMLTSTSGTTYVDSSVVALTTYYYVVASENAAGAGLAGEVSVMTPTPPKLTTTTTLVLSAAKVLLGGTETLTGSVAPSAATGTITFKDGSKTLQTVNIASGQAILTTGALAGGSHSFTAVYSGDATYADSTSAPQTVIVPAVAADFSLHATPATILVAAGQTASYTVSLTPIGGFNSAITFACSGAPSTSTCAFSPATVTLDGATASTSTLTITTAGKASAGMVSPGKIGKSLTPLYLAFLPVGFGVFFFGGKQRRNVLRKLMLGGTMLTILCMFGACGGSSKPVTPTSVNTVTITATGGGATHTTTVTLDVQQY